MWWVALEFVSLYSRRHQDLAKYFTKEVEIFTVYNLHGNFVTKVVTQFIMLERATHFGP